ncbi:NAD(P)-binding protein [Lojkania enalia]|uniref:NAD(P)-binding protein n=1 Tax=Lojkania enalia TaxID=147567 RepID=A0A9P4KE69_9PLEO|nr:NAD(P)-binding protein [Didymosphaeria enalia]
MLTFGIIGTNWITHSFVSSAQATSKWRLAAVYSRRASTAQDFASKYDQQVTCYTSLSDLAASEEVSTVYIASPNSLHHAHAETMLRAGKHVILEKPATCTTQQLDTLFAIARERGVVLLEAFRHLHEANFKVLKNNLDKLGPLCGATLNYAQYSSRYDAVLRGEVPNIFNLDFGGGALVDLGVYVVAAAIELFGQPRDVKYYPVIVQTGADGGGVLVMQYEGFAVSGTASKIFEGTAPCEVYGQRGTLVVDGVTDIGSVVYLDPKRKGERMELARKKEDQNLKEEAAEFVRIIEERDWEAVKRWEEVSRGVVRVTEKMRRDNGLLFPVERECGEGGA